MIEAKLSKVRFLEQMFPEALNSLSEAELDAQIHKYFLASLPKTGYKGKLTFHQSSGFDSGSGLLNFNNCSIATGFAAFWCCFEAISQLPSFFFLQGGSLLFC